MRPVGIEERYLGIRRVGTDDHRQLVKADSPVAVGKGPRKFRSHFRPAGTAINYDKVVSKPMHLHERQAHILTSNHGRAYRPVRASMEALAFRGNDIGRKPEFLGPLRRYDPEFIVRHLIGHLVHACEAKLTPISPINLVSKVTIRG